MMSGRGSGPHRARMSPSFHDSQRTSRLPGLSSEGPSSPHTYGNFPHWLPIAPDVAIRRQFRGGSTRSEAVYKHRPTQDLAV